VESQSPGAVHGRNEAQLSRGAHAEYKCVDSKVAPRLKEAAAV
jgi:hypothetical protein